MEFFNEQYSGVKLLGKEKHLEAMRVMGADDKWYSEWDTVVDRLAENGKLVADKLFLPTETKSNYYYMQNASSACAAINGVRSVCHLLEMLERIDPVHFQFQRFFEPWLYMCYHAIGTKQERPDYGYGGCSISGIMACINKYGLLPYSAASERILSDKELVRLNWNTRKNYQSIYEKYIATAEKWQVATTVAPTFDDALLALKCGYPIAIGTDIAVKKDSDGIYHLAGRTAHAMNWVYGGKTLNGTEYIGYSNDYGDLAGYLSVAEAKRQWNRNFFDHYVVIGLERN